MSDPAMYGFMALVAAFFVGLGVWYVTAEYYSEREAVLKSQNRILVEHNRVLQDELRKVDKSLVNLDASLKRYGDVLEGEPLDVEVRL